MATQNGSGYAGGASKLRHIVNYVYSFQLIRCNSNCKRHTPRTPGIQKLSEEPEAAYRLPDGSNFIKHADSCKQRPREHDFFQQWTPQNPINPEKASSQTSVISSSGEAAKQATFMQDWTRRGLETPQKVYSARTFRELLVKGIIEDDLPFNFVEGKGMKNVFEFLLPVRTKIPSASTVSRDLNKLHTAMSSRLTEILKVRYL